jgi:hypothetical protein
LREIAGGRVNSGRRAKSKPPSPPKAGTENADDFDEVLQDTIVEGTEPLPLDAELQQDPEPQTEKEIVQASNTLPQTLSRRARTQTGSADLESVSEDVSTEDMRDALSRIGSEIETLMENAPANLADDNEGNEEAEEETVIEDDRSLNAIVRRMSHEGMSQSQIAQQLGLPREEIALILSIGNDRN